MIKNIIIRKHINKVIAIIILVILAYITFSKLKTLNISFSEASTILKNPDYLYLVPAIILVFPNWYLEAYKWHLLIKREMNSSIHFAFKSVLTGVSIGTIVPYRLGEYIGRVFLLPENKKIKGILLYMIGSWAQLSITLIMGLLGALYIGSSALSFSIKIYVFAIISLILLLIYFRKKWVNYIIRKNKNIQIFKAFVVLKNIEHKTIYRVVFCSWLRYIIFSTQFVLFLMTFGLTFNGIIIFAKTFWMYLLQSLIPSFLPTEIGVRALLPIQLFQNYISNENIIGLTIASLSIYVINIILPGLMGLFYIFNAKLK